MKCGFFQWLILAKLDQNKMTKVWEIDQTVPRLKYFLFQLFLWWSVSTLRCSLKCQQSPDQSGWDPDVLSHDEDPLKRNFLWRFYWIVIKHLTLGNIVPCLRPVSSDLNTLVTSSSSLLVNSSGWLVMLLLIYRYVNLYLSCLLVTCSNIRKYLLGLFLTLTTDGRGISLRTKASYLAWKRSTQLCQDNKQWMWPGDI